MIKYATVKGNGSGEIVLVVVASPHSPTRTNADNCNVSVIEMSSLPFAVLTEGF